MAAALAAAQTRGMHGHGAETRNVARVLTVIGLLTGGEVAVVAGPATAALADVPSSLYRNVGAGTCMTADPGTPHDYKAVVQSNTMPIRQP
jgi:hypothetical protein